MDWPGKAKKDFKPQTLSILGEWLLGSQSVCPAHSPCLEFQRCQKFLSVRKPFLPQFWARVSLLIETPVSCQLCAVASIPRCVPLRPCIQAVSPAPVLQLTSLSTSQVLSGKHPLAFPVYMTIAVTVTIYGTLTVCKELCQAFVDAISFILLNSLR